MSEIANQINNKRSMIDAREPDQDALGTMMRNLIDGLAAFFLNGLRTKKCLIVIDNFWDCDSFQNTVLPKNFLLNHENPSLNLFEKTKIIITSRIHYNQYIENSLKWYCHEVKLLGKEDGYDLLYRIVFNCTRTDVRAKEHP